MGLSKIDIVKKIDYIGAFLGIYYWPDIVVSKS